MLDKQIVTNAYFDKDEGVIVHVIPQEGKKSKRVEYAAVIGGISWPTDTSPAYFCILEERWNREPRYSSQKKEKGNLVLLDEYESRSLSLFEFFNKLTDGVKQYHAKKLFADIGEEFRGHVETFRDYVRGNKIKDPRPSLSEAPYLNNFLLGVHLITEYEREKKIDIPEGTIVHKQLKAINREHLKDKPEVNFYAINALRFCVAAYFKFKYGPVILPRRRRQPGFMAA